MKYLLAITLSANEFDLLKVFAENPNRPLQRRGSR
jgi:DNA-binding response OmpR family regulator